MIKRSGPRPTWTHTLTLPLTKYAKLEKMMLCNIRVNCKMGIIISI